VESELQLLDQVSEQIDRSEAQIGAVIEKTPDMRLLMTLPGVGPILATVIALEVGSVERFPDAPRLASYAGTVPRVHASGGKSYLGKIRPNVNRYLRWALIEAANCIVMQQHQKPHRHVTQLYQRLRQRKGHGKAVVAVARHLAEATYWVLKKQAVYREPQAVKSVLSTPT
jgi:transposase